MKTSLNASIEYWRMTPWPNPDVDRSKGSIRRECLNHVIVFCEVHLRRILDGYLSCYHRSRTHLSLEKDGPTPRRVQAVTTVT